MTDINHASPTQIPSSSSLVSSEKTSQEEAFARAGASAAGEDSSQSASLQEELPMIVWLRGDESYADEFIVDAEQAMDILGIKRSRLTQISGKELRVGRIRIDRYIRPMYRLQDVQAYKNWTRATAAHTKSSEVIHEAAHKLESHADRLADRFDSSIKELSQSIQDLLETENHAMMSVHAERLRIGFDQCGQGFEKLAHLMDHYQNQHKIEVDKQKIDLEKELKRQQLQLEETKIQIEHMNQLLIDTQTVCKSVIQLQSQFHKDFANILTTVLSSQKEQNEQLRQLKENIEKQNTTKHEAKQIISKKRWRKYSPMISSSTGRE